MRSKQGEAPARGQGDEGGDDEDDEEDEGVRARARPGRAKGGQGG